MHLEALTCGQNQVTFIIKAKPPIMFQATHRRVIALSMKRMLILKMNFFVKAARENTIN